LDHRNGADSKRGVPKGDKRARTRAALLEAARELVREKGYERTTMEEVAARAGMTSGAIYGNFKSKNDLLIALGHAYWKPIVPPIAPGASLAGILRAIADGLITAIPDRRLAAVGRLTGMAYALAHDDLRRQVREVTAASYAAGAEWVRSVVDERDLPMPADQLVAVIHALIEGLTFQRLLTPELITDDVIRAAFAALAVTPPERTD
jgi:AcrR family transcriptional regulator